jgi:hypothetical protein
MMCESTVAQLSILTTVGLSSIIIAHWNCVKVIVNILLSRNKPHLTHLEHR